MIDNIPKEFYMKVPVEGECLNCYSTNNMVVEVEMDDATGKLMPISLYTCNRCGWTKE